MNVRKKLYNYNPLPICLEYTLLKYDNSFPSLLKA